MASESTAKKVSRVRPPRVHILYEVEIGGAMKEVELPYVVGVLSDLSGDNAGNLPALQDRKFDEFNRDNLNGRMKDIAPEISFRVNNTLAGDGTQLPVKLKFEHMDDFSPANVAKQVEPLKLLLEERQRLSEMLRKLDGNQKLEKIMDEVLANTEKAQEVAKQLGSDAANNPPKGD